MRSLLAIALFFTVTLSAYSQGGSNYSALGLGDLRTTVGGVYDAMGGTTIAIPTPYSINVTNPALLGQATTTRIQVGYRFNQHVVESGDRSIRQNNGAIDGVLAMFSVDTAHGFGISLGILPYSKVNYYTQRELITELNGQTVTGYSKQLGEGGVSQLHLGSSVRLLPGLQFGLSMGALFGVLTYSDEVTVNGPFRQVISSQNYDVRGLLFRGGLYWSATPWLNLGAFVSTGGNASVYITREAISYPDTVNQISESTTPLPFAFGVGASSKFGRSVIGADVEIGNYEDITVNVRDDAGYSSSLRASLGYSHQPSMLPTSTFWNKLGYHAGLSYQQLYVTYQNANIREIAGSGGVSFPLGGNAMVDAGLTIGWREPDGLKALNEYFSRLTVSISIGETWFKPFARE